MIYRKAPPQPVRLLLRVVAVTGAGTMLGAAACSSSSSGISGFVPPDAGVEDSNPAPNGSVDGGFAVGFYDGSNGSVDGGGLYDGLSGSVANPEAGPCEDGCGLVANPDGAADVVHGLAPLDGGVDE